MKPFVALDVECYRDYFLLMFKNIQTGNARSFELFDGQALDVEEIKKVLKRYCTVGFNSRNYDIPIIEYALRGADNTQLKDASDTIIIGGLKPWEFERKYNLSLDEDLDHIDIIEVAPGRASLKIYSGRMHCRKMQDLPIEPGAFIAPEKRPILRAYCGNDLGNTISLFNYLKPQIELREKMSKEYGQDLRSKSDAQIAEAVIRSKVADLLKRDIFRPPVYPGTGFKYKAPAYIQYSTQEMCDMLAIVQWTTFVISKTGNVDMPDALGDYKIRIGNGVYRMGIGGLHSSESCAAHLADEDIRLIDHDVASYYPAIILNTKLFPKHIGPEFLQVYKDIVDRRLAAKRAGDKVTADALKITVNGSFGKFGSKWSRLYSPELLIQTTITGQLALLMLIERLELEDDEIHVVSANTDGIVVKCPDRLVSLTEEIIKQWERDTDFETESTEYAAVYSRDVNNYIAVKKSGGVKTKGAYAEAGLQKNPTNTICVDAVVKFLTSGVAVEETIRSCDDIRKFLTIRQVKGGAVRGETYLGKAARWYYSTLATGAITYKTNGNTVARSEGARPLMDLPDQFPPDVDYDWYIDEARSILKDIGWTAGQALI